MAAMTRSAQTSSLLSCFWGTGCFYVEWLTLAPKGLGCIALCVDLCGYAANRHARAPRLYMRMSWVHRPHRPARHPHIHLISIHANSLIHKCAWVTRYYDDVMPIDTHVRSPRRRINEAWSWKRDGWAQIAANSNISLSAFCCIQC